MNPRIKLCLLSSLMLSTPAFATTVSLEYSGFHDRLKLVKKGDFPRTELTFSVPMKAGCKIVKGEINTESKRFPLTITDDQRLFVPFDDDLKLARALVNIETDGDASTCGLSLQVRERVPQKQYSRDMLVALKSEMDSLQASLQGFPMKYFARPSNGIRFEFAQEGRLATVDGSEKRLSKAFILTSEELDGISQLSFSDAPQIVSPWYAQTK